jgi:GMP synthase-like glutamine amidotransferase
VTPDDDAPRALVIQHTEGETVALLGDWLAGAGLRLDVVRPYAGEPLPAGLERHGALIVLGGPQSAYDDVSGPSAPWLPATKALLREAAGTDTPTLGICLGAQLLADALGGRVAPGEQGPEFGAALVAKRDVAALDVLWGPVPFLPDVVQWHFDEITDLPAGAVLLASSTRYPNQAFRVGDHAYGLQFHIETTPDMVRRWAENDAEALAAYEVDVEALLAGVAERQDDLAEVWRPFATRFAGLVSATVG